MNKILFYILLLVFPLGQIGSILRTGEITLLLNDISVGFVAAFWLIYSLIKKRKIIIPSLAPPLALFSLFALFSLVLNSSNLKVGEFLIAASYLIRWVAYAALFLVFSNLKIKQKTVIKGLISVSLIASLIGILQFIFFPDLRKMEAGGWDPHLFRLTAPFFDPAFTGAIFILGLALLICGSFERKINLRVIITGFIIYFAAALTYSRAVYLMYLIVISIVGVVKKSPRFFLFALLLGFLTVILLPKDRSYGTNLEREETVSARLKNWQDSIAIWRKNPVWGVGFNAYRYTQRDYGIIPKNTWQKSHSAAGADSSLLFVAATTGLIGLIIYMLLIWEIIKVARYNLNNTMALTLFISTISLLFHSFFANSLFYPWIMEWIWILSGSSQNFREREKDF